MLRLLAPILPRLPRQINGSYRLLYIIHSQYEEDRFSPSHFSRRRRHISAAR